jgi:copper chaperone CopZ
MATILLQVHGLQSADDEQRLETALRAQPGVFGAVASRQDGCAEVDVDDDVVTIDHLIHTARSAGFRAALRG